jgi:hypothetical protein
MNEDNWKREAVAEWECATCGSAHGHGSYTHPWTPKVVDDCLELIPPGQRIPYMKGAAVAFGLMGMAEAIRSRLCSECANPNSNHMMWCRLSPCAPPPVGTAEDT